MSAVDLSTSVGSVALKNPVMTAAGTAGHGAELGAYFSLDRLGAIVVKSLSVDPWPGNPPPRVTGTPGGMLNSVGLQGPGVASWLAEHVPALQDARADVIASIWGRHVDDFAKAASILRDAPLCVKAVEVNVSCPNLDDRSKMFAHSPSATAEAVAAAECGLPRWVKLSPNVADIAEIAAAALGAGAEALVLVNTVLGMAIDVDERRPILGARRGGMSGPAMQPVALRAVYDCREAFPNAPIVGVGGISTGRDAVAFLLAGANAIEVGTATLVDPHAPVIVLEELARWCEQKGVREVTSLIGSAHG